MFGQGAIHLHSKHLLAITPLAYIYQKEKIELVRKLKTSKPNYVLHCTLKNVLVEIGLHILMYIVRINVPF